MKNKIQQELDRKEFENDIGKDLKLMYEELDAKEKFYANHNKYTVAAFHFFGTLIVCYITFYGLKLLFNVFFGTALAMLGISFAWLTPLIHGAIWVASVYSVYRRRSVLDDLIDRIAR